MCTSKARALTHPQPRVPELDIPPWNKVGKQLEFSTGPAGRAGVRKLENNGTGVSCSGWWSCVARHCARLEPHQGRLLTLPMQDSSRAAGTVAAAAPQPAIKASPAGLSEEHGGNACPGPELEGVSASPPEAKCSGKARLLDSGWVSFEYCIVTARKVNDQVIYRRP